MIINNKLKLLLTSLCLAVCGSFNVSAIESQPTENALVDLQTHELTAEKILSLFRTCSSACDSIKEININEFPSSIKNAVNLYVTQMQQTLMMLVKSSINSGYYVSLLKYFVNTLNKSLENVNNNPAFENDEVLNSDKYHVLFMHVQSIKQSVDAVSQNIIIQCVAKCILLCFVTYNLYYN